ncbi:MAG: SdrD B-like domain-containing protein, partial [Spirosomataceae bacterium]
MIHGELGRIPSHREGAQFFDGNKVVNFAMNPQPILSSISFDADGSMLLGFMDRFGLFSGYRNMRPKDDGMLYDGFVGGDILRAQYNPSSNDFTLESNGKSGTLTGVGAGNTEGPGGGEFFGDDVWKFFGKPTHNEITNGGILVLPGLGEIMVSAMDPVDEIYQSGGVRTFNRTDGSMIRGFALYSDVPGTLGKSGGVGELKIDCEATAIEIGNRIWYDKNFDGIQDPDETGVDGVIVELYDMDNN